MKRRLLGQTDLQVPVLAFGGSSLGEEFGPVDLPDALRCVRVAHEQGLALIDTAPYYGRGMSEILVGLALRDVPRRDVLLSTKVGRYDRAHFDYSPRRVAESVDVSLHRLRTDYLDIVFCHDVEYCPLSRIVEETLPALRLIQRSGKARYIGISGYPQKALQAICRATAVDCVLNYNQYTLQNTRYADETIGFLKSSRIGVINSGPFAARLLTEAPLPPWHKSAPSVRAAAARAREYCAARGVNIAKLALQFSLANPDISTTIAGTADPAIVRDWVHWADEPVDQPLLDEVIAFFAPVRNIGHEEGLPENN